MIDFTNVKAITLGGQSVKQIARGSAVLWKEEQPGPVGPDYLCFEAAEAGSTVSMAKYGSAAPSVTLYYSRDKDTWYRFTVGTTTVTLTNVGDRVYFRGNNTHFGAMRSGSRDGNRFVMTGKLKGSGNLMSIFDGDNMGFQFTADYAACSMFRLCDALLTAPRLPATTLSISCYYEMFYGCTSLVTAPELPATTLAGYCYSSMFYGCTSLVTAPELPATTLADYCYSNMFNGCTSLVTAPELPATTLAGFCYSNMFNGCTSLVTAPELPATTLAGYCYSSMFYGCTSLSELTVAFASWTSGTYNWLDAVSLGGVFRCPADLDVSIRDASHIPAGWTVVNV